MKTILPLFSLTIVITTTLALGGIMPPAQKVEAEMTPQKAVERVEKTKTVNVSSEAVKSQETPPAQAVEPVRTLSEHQTWMQEAGIPEAEWPIVEDILGKEGQWCTTKWEGEIGYCPAYHGVPNTGGYGMCQSTPGVKMAVMGEGWETNPVLQLKWGHQYAQQYGGWAAAKEFRDCLGSCYSTRTKSTPFKATTWF